MPRSLLVYTPRILELEYISCTIEGSGGGSTSDFETNDPNDEGNSSL